VPDAATAKICFDCHADSYGIGDFADKKTAFDALFKSIDPTPSFGPQQFAAVARTVRARF
jgi:hypothetical protein